MKMKPRYFVLAVAVLVICAIPFRAKLQRPVISGIQLLRGKKTVADRVEQFGSVVQARLAPEFERIGVSYPPNQIILVGIKQENRLEVWISDPPQLLKSYPILRASGNLGPKLREGDRQVPEGLYRIESLNPNSMYHLALRVNYPNAFDLEMGRMDGRDNLGSDIMIHGKNVSIGCLAMGDEAAEDLFILAAETGIENISVIFTPVDFRTGELPPHMPDVPHWTSELYEMIKSELMKLGKTTR